MRVIRLVGILMVVISLGIVCYNEVDDIRAGMSAEEKVVEIKSVIELKSSNESETVDVVELEEDKEMSVVEIDGVGYVGYIDIPILEISLPVANELSYEQLRETPCRYIGDIYNGDMIVCAHNYQRHFGLLKNLNIGDEIIFKDVNGVEYRYTINKSEVLDKYDVNGLKGGDWDLTLSTCTIGGESRVVIRCKLL